MHSPFFFHLQTECCLVILTGSSGMKIKLAKNMMKLINNQKLLLNVIFQSQQRCPNCSLIIDKLKSYRTGPC
jgi:hypothetical protein